jgi:hypothetical protein
MVGASSFQHLIIIIHNQGCKISLSCAQSLLDVLLEMEI